MYASLDPRAPRWRRQRVVAIAMTALFTAAIPATWFLFDNPDYRGVAWLLAAVVGAFKSGVWWLKLHGRLRRDEWKRRKREAKEERRERALRRPSG